MVISQSAKLDYQMGFMVVRQMEITRIHLNEIALLLIESTAVSITCALLAELTKKKVKIIFCDEKRNPSAEVLPYYGSHDTSAKIRIQIEWEKDIKSLVWTEIVSEKIRNQMQFLKRLGKLEEAALLNSYIEKIEIGDVTNREGHAAKVYFNAVFGKDFSRTQEIPVNAALNYGYGIILSMINREIVSNGYITQIGLFHDNMFNAFNLGSDLMEPFRILIDRAVYAMQPDQFEHEEKMRLLSVLQEEVMIDGKNNYVTNAIKLYCKSVFDAINEKDVSLIKFYQM